MRVLITNCTLGTRTGTETYVRDLALGLRNAGQEVTVYSPILGDIAGEISAAGIPVVSSLRQLPAEPEVIHGHNYMDTARAMLRFPGVPAVFVCHRWHGLLNLPPRLSGIRRYVAVDHNCRGYLLNQPWIPRERLRLICNPVDTSRFRPRPPLPPTPRSALIFSSYAKPGTHLEPVRAACNRLGIRLDVMGFGSGTGSIRPEESLARYDLVFAKARCAIEAMAVGNAVVLCDFAGLGGMVSAGTVAEFRPFNFGRRLLHWPLETCGIIREIERYDPADTAKVSRYIREEASLERCVADFLDLYREVLHEDAPGQGTRETRYVSASGRGAVALQALLLRLRLASVGLPFNRLWPSSFFQRFLWPTTKGLREWILRVLRRGTYRAGMNALPESVRRAVRMTVVSAPAEVPRGATFVGDIAVENGTMETLCALDPYPLYLCWHWRADNGQEYGGPGGNERKPLHPALKPGEKAVIRLRVEAPPERGAYRFRCTLLQEHLCRFDQGSEPVFAEAMVEVR